MSLRPLRLTTFAFVLAFGCVGADGELRRQAMFGAVLGEAEDGVLLKQIIAGSSAAEGGFRDGDIVFKLGERKTDEIPSLLAALADRRAGDRVVVGYLRDGEKKETAVTLKEKLREKGDGYEVI